MVLLKHGDGKVLSTHEDPPILQTLCTVCEEPIDYKAGAFVPLMCTKCQKKKD